MMSNKLKANFIIKVDKVFERAVCYAHVRKVIESQLDALSNYKHPPLVEQVHPVIYWLHRYSATSKKLLNELERVLSRIQDYEFNGKDNLLSNFGSAADKEKFNSAYSELFLANFLMKNGIMLVEYAPFAKNGKAKADFKIYLGKDNAVILELVTPDQESNDFESKAHFLFEKLERVQSGFSIEISGFESYDSSTLWHTSVEAPTHKQIEEMITNFRKFAFRITDDELPKVLPPLCRDYPRIKITIQGRIPHYPGTFVASSASRSGEGIPIGRLVKLIIDEREHLSPNDCNFVFVDFSYWSRIDRHYLDAEVYRKIIIEALMKKMSSRINGVLTYIMSNQKDERLVSRRVLYLNSNKPSLNKSEVQRFLKFWESGD